MALAGCGLIKSIKQSSPMQTPCCVEPTASAHIPATGILVSMNPDNRGDHQPWTAQAGQVASAVGQSHARVIIDRFGAGPGSAEVTFDALVAPGSSAQNKLISDAQLVQAEKHMVVGFLTAMAITSPGPVDLLGSIVQMEGHLREVHAMDPDLLIFGDAVQTAGPVNLADPVQLADPKMALAALKRAGLLQSGACHGINAYMIDPWPTGWSSLQVTELREFWREYFEACGGHLVLWDSALVAFPASGQVPGAPQLGNGGELPVQLPASVLFVPNEAVFRLGAGKALGELCRKMTVDYPHSTAAIAGYTAQIGAGDGMALSLARARAVAAYLTGGSCGVRPSRLVSVKGFGDHDPVPGGLAANRRVMVTIQTH
jgi:hypothetical protein